MKEIRYCPCAAQKKGAGVKQVHIHFLMLRTLLWLKRNQN